MQPDLASERVELERADPHPSRAGPAFAAPQQRSDPGLELGIGERLSHVVVTPAPEAAQAVELAGPARYNEDREVRVEPPSDAIRLAHFTQEVQSVAVRESEIKDRQIRELGGDHVLGVAGGLRLQDLVAVCREIVG